MSQNLILVGVLPPSITENMTAAESAAPVVQVDEFDAETSSSDSHRADIQVRQHKQLDGLADTMSNYFSKTAQCHLPEQQQLFGEDYAKRHMCPGS